MDLHEINTYRLFEGSLPMETPKYYYGDISCTTSNFILITARVPFAEQQGKKQTLQPFDVEGPYDKCKDFQLRGEPREYYMLLVCASAKIAGRHKAGEMGSEAFIHTSVGGPRAPPKSPELWGMDPDGFTGGVPDDVAGKVRTAVKFVAETARALFPEYVTTEAFQSKFTTALMKAIAYRAEIDFWKHSDPAFGSGPPKSDRRQCLLLERRGGTAGLRCF